MYRMDRSLRLRKKTKERAKTNNPPEVCACIPSHIAHRKQTPQTVLWFSALTAVVSLSLSGAYTPTSVSLSLQTQTSGQPPSPPVHPPAASLFRQSREETLRRHRSSRLSHPCCPASCPASCRRSSRGGRGRRRSFASATRCRLSVTATPAPAPARGRRPVVRRKPGVVGQLQLRELEEGRGQRVPVGQHDPLLAQLRRRRTRRGERKGERRSQEAKPGGDNKRNTHEHQQTFNE